MLISLSESLKLTREAEDEHDECPECGQDYTDIDTTGTGDLVFIHQEEPFKSCTVSSEEAGSDD